MLRQTGSFFVKTSPQSKQFGESKLDKKQNQLILDINVSVDKIVKNQFCGSAFVETEFNRLNPKFKKLLELTIDSDMKVYSQINWKKMDDLYSRFKPLQLATYFPEVEIQRAHRGLDEYAIAQRYGSRADGMLRQSVRQVGLIFSDTLMIISNLAKALYFKSMQSHHRFRLKRALLAYENSKSVSAEPERIEFLLRKSRIEDAVSSLNYCKIKEVHHDFLRRIYGQTRLRYDTRNTNMKKGIKRLEKQRVAMQNLSVSDQSIFQKMKAQRVQNALHKKLAARDLFDVEFCLAYQRYDDAWSSLSQMRQSIYEFQSVLKELSPRRD